MNWLCQLYFCCFFICKIMTSFFLMTRQAVVVIYCLLNRLTVKNQEPVEKRNPKTWITPRRRHHTKIHSNSNFELPVTQPNSRTVCYFWLYCISCTIVCGIFAKKEDNKKYILIFSTEFLCLFLMRREKTTL